MLRFALMLMGIRFVFKTLILINMKALGLLSHFSRRPSPRFSTSQSSGEDVHRLERILSNRGRGSRKEVAALIKKGKVRVNGAVVKVPSARFPTSSAIVTVDGLPLQAVPLLVAFNKPLGVLSSMGDPQNRPNLVDFVPPEWKSMGLHPVGRLGKTKSDTESSLLRRTHTATSFRCRHNGATPVFK